MADKSASKFIIKNLPKDLKVTKNPSSIVVSPVQSYTAGTTNRPIQLGKPLKLDKLSQEKLMAVRTHNSVIVTKDKVSKEEFHAGSSKIKLIEKVPQEGFTQIKKAAGSKLVNSIQIINGRATTNHLKLIPASENVHIRNFDNPCPATPPKMIVKNRFIDDLKTSPRLSSRSQSVDSSPGKIEKTVRRLSHPINFNDQEEKDAKLINENRDEIESLLCSENVGNISDENKSLEDLKEESSKIDRFGYRTDVDFFNQVKWINGITYLNKSNLHFRYNELGLVDLIDEKQTHKLNLTKMDMTELAVPLNRRDGYDEIIKGALTCKICSSSGSSYEFLTKSICSIECMNLAEKQYEAKSVTSPVVLGETIPTTKTVEQKPSFLQHSFIWDSYLTTTKGIPAPLNLFKNPIPISENLFEIGMKLEAIDPLNASKFCVCTVVSIQGYRIKLSFDGYSSEYDFWVNADSMDIFPPGWCEKTGRTLISPPACRQITFIWKNYLELTKTRPAPDSNFKHLINVPSHKNPFKIGMKLEADDLKNSGRITVATVEDVLDNRILVSFDGYSKEYCYWTDISAPYIHPVNWHKQCGFSIIAPPNVNNFSWHEYLNGSIKLMAPSEYFICRKTIPFQPGMKLEVVDRKLPCLIRPATVLQSMENGIKVLYDGWPEKYNYWLPDDSPDLHPVNWCRKTNHALEYPANWQSFYRSSCKVDGCRGIGNANRKHSAKHFSAMDCPYEYTNWIKEVIVPTRFNHAVSAAIINE